MSAVCSALSSAVSSAAGPIDIVYLWVDGADPVWQQRRQQAYAAWVLQHPQALAAFGNVAGRYRDNGELRYSLRALEKFFPAHGHVYIVTDGQTPPWLQSSKRVSVIDHSSLIPAGDRPVFDSGHIESYLHHIPGLSERFLYLNDDVFLGAPLDPDWWFGERLKVFIESARIPAYSVLQQEATALVNASIQSNHWLRKYDAAYRHDHRVYAHAPRPMLKSATQQLEDLAPALFAQLRSTVFRSWRVPTVVPDLLPRWMVHTGIAEQVVQEPLYISTCDADAPLQFDALQRQFGALPFFCINDTCDDALDDDPRLLRIGQTLAALLPEPSSFERAAVQQNSESKMIAASARV